MSSMFKKAVRERRKLRAALDGPPGSGKTYSALRLAFSMVRAGMATRVALIDTENESASLYAGEAPDGLPWEFDTLNLKTFGPDNFTAAIGAADREGYDCIVIDSLSHAWIGKGGALDLVDQKQGNKFTAWKDITPMQRKMVDAMIQSPAHIIATMRSKVEWVMEEEVNRQGKKVQVPRKVGMAPQQREGLEYEFDIYGSCDDSHQIKITKTRCSLLDNATTIKPGPDFWQPLFDWLKSGAPAPVRVEAPAAPAPAPDAAPGPDESPDSLRADFLVAIDTVATLDGAKKLGGEIKEATESGRITPAIADELRPLFAAKVKALKGAAAAKS